MSSSIITRSSDVATTSPEAPATGVSDPNTSNTGATASTRAPATTTGSGSGSETGSTGLDDAPGIGGGIGGGVTGAGTGTGSSGLSQGAVVAIAILATLVGLMSIFIGWILYDRRKLQQLLRKDLHPKTTLQVSGLQTFYTPQHEQSLPTYGQTQELHGQGAQQLLEGPQHPELPSGQRL